MPIDLLGPASAVGAVTTRPAEGRQYGATDTWFTDCTSPSARDGTQLQAVFLNALLDQLRYALRASGIPLDNADASMLWQAMQAATAGIPFGVASGSPTSLFVEETVPPLRTPYDEGRVVLIAMPANLSIGAGAQLRFGLDEPSPIVRNDGTPIQSGDGPPLSLRLMAFRTGRWQLLTPGEAEYPKILGASTLYVATNGNDGNDGLSEQSPLLTIDAALKRSTTFYTIAKPLTLQLLKTGSTGVFDFPANQTIIPGTLIIRGDPNAQAGFIVQGVGPSGGGGSVIGSGGEKVRLVGLTVRNTGTINHTLSSASRGSMEIERVTLTSSAPLPLSHFFVSGSAAGTIGPGVRWASSAASMMTASGGDMAITTNASLFVDGNLNFSDAAAVARDFGRISARGGVTITRSGTVTGVRYRTVDAKIVASGLGSELFPGDQPGVATGAGGYSQ